MPIYFSEHIKENVEAQILDFIGEQFFLWKSVPAKENFYFGRDTQYITPEVNGMPYVLSHVHLPPPENNIEQYNDWCNKFKKNRGGRWSHNILVYVKDNTDYLLIGILKDPDGHKIGQQKTSGHKAIMSGYAKMAEDFIYNRNKKSP